MEKKKKPSLNISPIKAASELNTRGFDGMIPVESQPDVSAVETERAPSVRNTSAKQVETERAPSTQRAKDPRKNITFSLKVDVIDNLKTASKNEGVPASSIIMAALDLFFKKHPEMTEVKQKEKKGVDWDRF